MLIFLTFDLSISRGQVGHLTFSFENQCMNIHSNADRDITCPHSSN